MYSSFLLRSVFLCLNKDKEILSFPEAMKMVSYNTLGTLQFSFVFRSWVYLELVFSVV